MKTPKPVCLLVIVLLVATSGIQAFAESRWSSSIILGEGTSPKFIYGGNKLSLIFEGENQFMQSFYRGNGQWSTPALYGKYKAGLTAIDKNGIYHEIISREDGVYYLSCEKNKWSPQVRIDQEVRPLYFYIDNNEVKHLVCVKPHSNKTDLIYKFQIKGDAWKTEMIARNIQYFRDWQEPGIATSPSGGLYVCTYNDLYFRPNDHEGWKHEKCRLDHVYMPVKMVCDSHGTIHFLFYSWAEGRNGSLNGFYYTIRNKSGKWNNAERIGSHQPSERIPAFILSRNNELMAAWEDNNGNINVSVKKSDR
jgi:hypothetical protein